MRSKSRLRPYGSVDPWGVVDLRGTDKFRAPGTKHRDESPTWCLEIGVYVGFGAGNFYVTSATRSNSTRRTGRVGMYNRLHGTALV